MKPTRREASIFSVSAIDLFASALGAFIVVALVLLPYFPNTGDAPAQPPVEPPTAPGISPAEVEALRGQADAGRGRPGRGGAARARAVGGARERPGRGRRRAPRRHANPISPAEVAAIRDRIARSEAELQAARARERELARALDAAMSSVRTLPAMDLVIALDTTASMTGEVASLREEIAGLSALLADLTDDAAVGIIDFKDGCGGPPALRIAPLQRVDRESVRGLTAFTRSMRPGSPPCNTTSDEDFAEALRAAVGADWRPDSELRSIVLISDNPAHGHLREQAVADAQPLLARSRRPAHRLGRARRHQRLRPDPSRYRGVHATGRRSGRRAVRPRRRERVTVGDHPARRLRRLRRLRGNALSGTRRSTEPRGTPRTAARPLRRRAADAVPGRRRDGGGASPLRPGSAASSGRRATRSPCP